jgi:hypothetical protein
MAVTWLIEYSTSHQLLWFIDSLCSEIRHSTKAKTLAATRGGSTTLNN